MESGERVSLQSDREGHGWWPYLAPYFSFLAVVELGRRLPESLALLVLVLKPALPLLLLVYFWRRGGYPELRRTRLDVSGALQDVAVGVALALLWTAPYLVFDGLRPDPSEAFDPAQLGVDWVPLVLGLRMFGYALVTPLFEEIFIRSFVMRYAEVYGRRGDFRDIALAHYSLRSFLATVVVFTVGHVPWEWWVAVPWVAISNAWFYHRRSLAALVLVHATTNASLLLWAILGAGGSVSLWFLV